MKIAIVSPHLLDRNQFLQPWRYLLQCAQALRENGHQVYFISDGSSHTPKDGGFAGYAVKRLENFQEWPLLGNKQLAKLINELHPEVVLWRLGLTSFLHLDTLQYISSPVVGIFTSPMYSFSELLQINLMTLTRDYALSRLHLIGLLTPPYLIRRPLLQNFMAKLVVECDTTRARMSKLGIRPNHLQVIKPYISPKWFQEIHDRQNFIQTRREHGFSAADFVVGFFGPPGTLRGLPVLIRAAKLLLQKEPRIRLLILSRLLHETNKRDNISILKLIKENNLEQQIKIIPGMLPEEHLRENLSICDVIALPFELVPSDVPLSILEAMALGIPLITTNSVCLPEMVPDGAGIRVKSGDAALLAEAILKLSCDSQLKANLSKKGKEQALSWTSIEESHRAWNNLVLQYESQT